VEKRDGGGIFPYQNLFIRLVYRLRRNIPLYTSRVGSKLNFMYSQTSRYPNSLKSIMLNLSNSHTQILPSPSPQQCSYNLRLHNTSHPNDRYRLPLLLSPLLLPVLSILLFPELSPLPPIVDTCTLLLLSIPVELNLLAAPPPSFSTGSGPPSI
jgi:hypothetical protein